MTSRWTHRAGDADHPVDPTYNGNGLPSWWTCHKCGDVLLLDGKRVPITGAAVAATHTESRMSAQP